MEPAPNVSGEGRSHDAPLPPPSQQQQQQKPSRYESQKRRDWNTFLQFLANRKPPLPLARCAGAHVVEFLEYLDQFGKTKVHASGCSFFGHPRPTGPCECPTKQAWASLDALIGRLRAAYEESGGHPESNPLGTKAVKAHLREVRESQAKARGVAYEKKRKRRQPTGAGNEASSSDHPITAEVASFASSSAATGSTAVRDSPAS